MTDLVKADMSDIERVASILADAFSEDPIMMWTLRTPEILKRSLLHLLPALYLEGGWITRSANAGAAVWLFPGGRQHLTAGQTTRLGLSMLPYLGITGLIRAHRVDGSVSRQRPDEPHLYLFMVGVSQFVRGTGLGSRLIEQGLDEAQKNGWPVYLETSQPDRVGYYQKKGFRLVSSFTPVKGAPTLWTMRRPPTGL